jgi:hypothetical protein
MSERAPVCHGSSYRRGISTQPWYTASKIKVLAGGVRATRRGASKSRRHLVVDQHCTHFRLMIAVREGPSFKKRVPGGLLSAPADSLSKHPRPPILVAAASCVLQKAGLLRTPSGKNFHIAGGRSDAPVRRITMRPLGSCLHFVVDCQVGNLLRSSSWSL